MNFRNLFIGAVAMLSLAACSKSDQASVNPAAVTAPAVDSNNVNAYEAGTPAFTFNIDSREALVDGAAINDSSFEGYPMLAAQHAELESVDKLILTNANSLELWSAGSIALALDTRDNSLLHSRSGTFSLESASWAMDAGGEGQGQGLSKGTLTLNMRECFVEQPKEQGQDQEKPIDEGKGQGEDQGKDQGQDQGKPVDEGKDQGKEEKAPEICRVLTYTYHVSEIEQPKEQDQGKDQGQDQGKPVDEGKGQGQDQGKPVDEGKPSDQGKDQGKEEGKPSDQGQDQGKGQGDEGQGQNPDDQD